MNDMQPHKPAFDFALVSTEQAMELKTIAVRLGIRVQRTAEEMLAMGADLKDAKRVCREDGTLFTAWCESSECPVGYSTAKRLMAVSDQLGHKECSATLFHQGFDVLARVTQTREEDIRQALLEHIESESEEGRNVTQKEITAIKKALKEAQSQAAQLEDQAFDAKAALAAEKARREQAERMAQEAEAKKAQYIADLMNADRQHKQLLKQVEGQQQALRDAEQVHREHLAEMRQQVAAEERMRPRTDAEEAAHQARLNELKDAVASAKVALNTATKAKQAAEVELNDTRKAVAMRDKVLGDWATAALGFREVALRLTGAAAELRRIPMTDELYAQIKNVRDLASAINEALREVTHVG